MIDWNSGPEGRLPLIGIPLGRPPDNNQLLTWLLANKEDVEHRLSTHGAILFRGFGIRTPELFQEIGSIFCSKFNDYVGGNSPRTRVRSHVFTATEYPKHIPISMHNESSYLKRMPDTVMFFCTRPADEGGQTPLADCRRVLDRIDPQVRLRFERNGIRYVNNMHGGVGLGRSWMEVFNTKSRDEVESLLKAQGQVFEWKSDGGLRTFMQAPAILRHPKALEEAWINQAEQWHPSSLDRSVREGLLSILGEENLPHNAFLGDGSPLNEQDLSNIREAMAAEEQVFDWQEGDMLLCDNILVMHGRRPYRGNRSVFVALGQF